MAHKKLTNNRRSFVPGFNRKKFVEDEIALCNIPGAPGKKRENKAEAKQEKPVKKPKVTDKENKGENAPQVHQKSEIEFRGCGDSFEPDSNSLDPILFRKDVPFTLLEENQELKI